MINYVVPVFPGKEICLIYGTIKFTKRSNRSIE